MPRKPGGDRWPGCRRLSGAPSGRAGRARRCRRRRRRRFRWARLPATWPLAACLCRPGASHDGDQQKPTGAGLASGSAPIPPGPVAFSACQIPGCGAPAWLGSVDASIAALDRAVLQAEARAHFGFPDGGAAVRGSQGAVSLNRAVSAPPPTWPPPRCLRACPWTGSIARLRRRAQGVTVRGGALFGPDGAGRRRRSEYLPGRERSPKYPPSVCRPSTCRCRSAAVNSG